MSECVNLHRTNKKCHMKYTLWIAENFMKQLSIDQQILVRNIYNVTVIGTQGNLSECSKLLLDDCNHMLLQVVCVVATKVKISPKCSLRMHKDSFFFFFPLSWTFC